ncbi:MAG: UDP-N-acetylmuramoyl-L-alanyl-D-glutamate--2,6-diaminopimelate ligase [Anaerolineales bacterium]
MDQHQILNTLKAHLPNTPITHLTADSRQVKPGTIFVACTGGNADGHRYIPNAIANGAVAVVGEQSLTGLPVPYLQVDDSRRALAHLAAALNDFPARHLTVLGVTGTDGKTTTSNLLYAILQAAGLPTGMVSTVNAIIGTQTLDTGFHVTTPDAPNVQNYLRMMVDAGLTHVILESTSHGLAQRRVEACEFDGAIVTNITHEHLDYHGSYEAYRAAKGRLFTMLTETLPKAHGNPRFAVLNRDDSSYDYLAQITTARQIAYGLHRDAVVRAENIRYTADGLHFTVHTPSGSMPIDSRLVGEYNVSNLLAAIAAAVEGLHLPLDAARAGIAAFQGVPGRMETIALGQDFLAIVDFAHTPNALQRTLEAARQMTTGRVIVVFGSAGLRDREKRRMMAEIATQYADLSIFTAEDPRTESLTGILAHMATGAEAYSGREGETFWRIPDRREALRFAVQLARKGDIVLACGKGHEQSMCFGETEYLWDDRTALRAALSELLGVEGVAMPYLPDLTPDT